MSSIASIDVLAQAIVSWSGRADISQDQLLQFMDFTGITAGQYLRVSGNLASVSQELTLNYLEVPVDLEELKGITLVNTNDLSYTKNLEYIPWSSFVNEDDHELILDPKYFTKRGGYYYFSPELPVGTWVRLDYYQKIPTLNQANPSNWLLFRYPMIYLYGCLKYLHEFVLDEERAAYWETRFEKELVKLQQSHDGSEYEGSILTVRRTNYD